MRRREFIAGRRFVRFVSRLPFTRKLESLRCLRVSNAAGAVVFDLVDSGPEGGLAARVGIQGEIYPPERSVTMP
jgi:hypothetical protein